MLVKAISQKTLKFQKKFQKDEKINFITVVEIFLHSIIWTYLALGAQLCPISYENLN